MIRSIIVCEREGESRGRLTRLLESWDFNVVEAGSETDAIQVLGNTTPGLVLVDAEISDSAGAAFVKAVRDLPATREIPIVILQSGQSDGIPEALASYSIDTTLQAAVKVEELRDVVTRAFPEAMAAACERPLFLVIDPNGTQRRIMRSALQRERCRALVCQSGDDAKTMIGDETIAGIIADLGGEERNATKILSPLSELADKDTPIIAVSAVVDLECVRQLFACGVRDILIKPIESERLGIAISNVLEVAACE